MYSPRRRRKRISLLEQIPVHPSVLPEVPDYMFCRAKRFYMEPPRFCCSAGEIHLTETQMPEKLVQLCRANTPEAREFRLCIRSYNNMFAFTSLGVHYDKILAEEIMVYIHSEYKARFTTLSNTIQANSVSCFIVFCIDY